MSKLRQAAQEALEAIDSLLYVPDTPESARQAQDAIDALRAALAEPEAQQPVIDVSREYEELRRIIDGGSESMTHDDAVDTVQRWREAHETKVPADEPIGYVAIQRSYAEHNDPPYLFYVDEDDTRASAAAFNSRYEIRPVRAFVFADAAKMGWEPPSPPDGYVLVPREPDQEMCAAGQRKAREWPHYPFRIGPIYRAMIDAAPTPPQPASPPGSGEPKRRIVWPKAREVQRDGDMAPPGDTRLRVLLDADNDVIVEVYAAHDDPTRFRSAAVEFCTSFGGGGQSPRTREALIALMVAMEADAAPTPPQREEESK